MSCCSGKCGCGANCKCGNGCSGCGMYPDLSSYSEAAGAGAATGTVILGVAPTYFGGSETVMGGSENGCKCGANCTCDPCTCK
ncbi:hypothetical protein ACP275_10G035500 [Erythranthe tilingii]